MISEICMAVQIATSTTGAIYGRNKCETVVPVEITHHERKMPFVFAPHIEVTAKDCKAIPKLSKCDRG